MNDNPHLLDRFDRLREQIRNEREANAFALGAFGGVTGAAGLSLSLPSVGELVLMLVALAGLLWTMQQRSAQ